MSSFGYWNLDSGRYLDLVFFGWYNDGGAIGFQPAMFLQARAEIEAASRWRYSGETDVLLLDFEVPITASNLEPGAFSFRHCIWLPVEAMMRDGRATSLDGLIHELVAAAKQVYDEDPWRGGAFEVSDRVAWTRGRRALWARLKQLVLRDWTRLYDELRPFAVCDLRPHLNRG